MNKIIDLTVIIPVYNSSETIYRALNSIIEQTVSPKEIIIIDDKSIDKTINKVNKYIEEYQGNIHIQLIELDINSGPAKARNTGWNKANTDYIAFLDSDDSWHPQKLEIQYGFMKKNKDLKLSGHLMKLSKNELPKIKNINFNKYTYKYISKKMQLSKNYFTTTSNIMIKNDIQLRFKEDMRYAEDNYLWIQICYQYKIALLLYPLGFAYKDFTGVSGLSENIKAMYKGSIHIYNILLDEGKISIIKYIYLVILRSLKFLKAFIKKQIKGRNNE